MKITIGNRFIQKLSDEIKVRHYLKKTLKAYTLWTEKFRYYTRNKLPKSLTPDDVKAFLTFLAVKKKVSAFSQHLAFNVLLFFHACIEKNIRNCQGEKKALHSGYAFPARN